MSAPAAAASGRADPGVDDWSRSSGSSSTTCMVYRRTWRGTVFSTVLDPSLFLAAMGVGLGSFIDDVESRRRRRRAVPRLPRAGAPRRPGDEHRDVRVDLSRHGRHPLAEDLRRDDLDAAVAMARGVRAARPGSGCVWSSAAIVFLAVMVAFGATDVAARDRDAPGRGADGPRLRGADPGVLRDSQERQRVRGASSGSSSRRCSSSAARSSRSPAARPPRVDRLRDPALARRRAQPRDRDRRRSTRSLAAVNLAGPDGFHRRRDRGVRADLHRGSWRSSRDAWPLACCLPAPIAGSRAHRLVERNLLVYRHGWIDHRVGVLRAGVLPARDRLRPGHARRGRRRHPVLGVRRAGA